MLENTPVMGRVLNPVNGGYSVGLAGIVAFCPISQLDFLTVTKIGVLQPFHVVSMNEAKRNVVLLDGRHMERQQKFEERRQQFERNARLQQSEQPSPNSRTFGSSTIGTHGSSSTTAIRGSRMSGRPGAWRGRSAAARGESTAAVRAALHPAAGDRPVMSHASGAGAPLCMR